MAAPTKYTPPHVQLGELAVAALRRGLSFDEFWLEAVRPDRPVVKVTHPDPPPGCVLWPSDPKDGRTWRSAIRETRGGWERAYNREPPAAAERAVAQLREWLSTQVPLTVDDEPAPQGIAA